MKKFLITMLAVLALATTLSFADGSDPMPLCRPSKEHPVCPQLR